MRVRNSVSRRVSVMIVAAGIALGATIVADPAPASSWAAPDEITDWWYDKFCVPEVQAEGLTGAGVTVAVIDEQINPDLEVFADADLTVDPEPLCFQEEPVAGDDPAESARVGYGRAPGGQRARARRGTRDRARGERALLRVQPLPECVTG